jgi:hypothetical protein
MRQETKRLRRLEGPGGVREVVSMVDEATDEPAQRNTLMVAMNEPGRVICAWNRELGGQLTTWFRAVSRL